MITERTIQLRQMAYAQVESSQLHLIRNVVSAFRDPLLDALPGDVQIGYPQKVDPDAIAGGPPEFQQWRISTARKCGLKRKIFLPFGQFAQTLEHDAPGLKRHLVRGKGRKPCRNQVGIHEFTATHLLRHKASHIGGLTGAIGTRYDE